MTMLTKPRQRLWERVATALLGLCTLAAIVLIAAPERAAAQQFTFRQYRQQDGLTNLTLTCLLQDRAGFIWMCTENGLFRHDGVDFERFGEAEGIEDTDVRTAIEDASGQLWVGTSHDLYLGDGHQFHAVRPNGRVLAVQPGAQIASLGPDRILIINENQLLDVRRPAHESTWNVRPYFTADQLSANPALQHVSSLTVDHTGRILMGCAEAICILDHGRVTTWDTHAGVPPDTWLSWLFDRDGRLWARGVKHLVMLDVGASRFVSRNPPHSGLTSQLLNVPLAQDLEGHIFTRTEGGLARLVQGHWQEYTPQNGIPAEPIVTLLVDRTGAVWLGTPGHGLSRWLGYGHFESWTKAQGLGGDVVWNVVHSAERGLLIGGEGGCQRLDPGVPRALPCGIEGLPSGEIQLLTERADKSLWIGMTTGNLFRVAPGKQHAQLIGHQSPIRLLYGDSKGRLWVCTSAGLSVADPGSTLVHPVPEMVGVGEFSDAIEDAHGVLWFASRGGLVRFGEGHWTVLKIDDEHARAGFSELAVAEDGTLWAGGSSHGLMHLTVEGDRVVSAEWVTDPMLTHASILFTKLDQRGWIWVGTDAGVAVYDGAVWREFTQADGLIWNDTNQSSFLADSDGSVWVGTSGGLTQIRRPEGLMESRPLDLRIIRATLGTESLDPGLERQIPWDTNTALDLHLADFDYGEARDTIMKVRLRGLSDAWLETRDRDLHYPGLGAGHYVFEATAIDRTHHRSSAPLALRFEVLPPWWRTPWFEGLVVASAFALLVAAWHWRMRKLRTHKRALERQLKEHEALLERATRDALTGLWNRTAILEILAREIEVAKREGTVMAVAIIDVDHFKQINDSCGHLGGDAVLRTLGAQLNAQIRSSDSLGRFGGEELLLVMPGMPTQRPCLTVERLRQSISEMAFFHEGAPISVTASFGMAWLLPDSDIPENLLGRADAALYAAKNAGRNRVAYAEPEWRFPHGPPPRDGSCAPGAGAAPATLSTKNPSLDWGRWFAKIDAS